MLEGVLPWANVSSWTNGPRELPSLHNGIRRNRDRLSDLESGALGEMAFEDEQPQQEVGKLLTVTVGRSHGSHPIGVELDMWARRSDAAAEVIVGAVTPGCPAEDILRVGDSIRAVNDLPCCTIEDVRRALGSTLQATFDICRPPQAELLVSEVMAKTVRGEWVKVMMRLMSSRLLELGGEQLNVRLAETVAILPGGRELQVTAPDVYELGVKFASVAELERWHTLLTQLTMFRSRVSCDLTGWLLRADGGGGGGGGGGGVPTDAWHYFELYSNGTVLIYSTPHRNKLGQALLAVSLSQCSVRADVKEPGTWLISDLERDGAVWRASFCQPSLGGGRPRVESAKQVFASHALAMS